jgi:Zn-dependent oligopeptidase
MDFRPFLNDAAFVTASTQCALAEANRALNDVDSVMSLDTTMTALFNTVMPIQFLRLVGVDEGVRAAASKGEGERHACSHPITCTAAMEELDRFELAVYGNSKVYTTLRQEAGATAEGDSLKMAALQRYIRDCEVKGAAHLADGQRAKVQALNNEIAALEAEFQRNIANDTTQVVFKLDELEGLDQSFLGSLKRNAAGDLLCTLQYPHVTPILRWAKSRDARERMWRANAAKAAHSTNMSLLPRIVALRLEKARCLGSECDADLCLGRNQRMVSYAEVAPMLAAVWDALQDKRLAEMRALSAMMDDGVVHPWDVSFAQNLYEERHHNIDQQALREYLPLEVLRLAAAHHHTQTD